MMHEHLFWDARRQWDRMASRPGGRSIEGRYRGGFRVDLAGPARFDVRTYRDNWANVGAAGYRRALSEMAYLLEAGGATLVDLTPHGIRPDPISLRNLSEATGLHIVASSGIYTHDTHDPWVDTASAEDLERFFRHEVTEGIGGSDVLPGVIGEIGTSARPRSCEIRVLRAAARVASEQGLALNIHCHPGSLGVTTSLIDATTSEGLPPSRTILSHLDEVSSSAYLAAVMARGVSVCFDGFGHQHYAGPRANRRSDRDKMRLLARLVERGYASQITISQDVCRLHMFRRYGGTGYDHVLARVIPTLESDYRVSKEALHLILNVNPARLLTRTAGRDPRPRTAGAGVDRS